MVNLYGLIIAFGGWNMHDGLKGLKYFEIWSPTLQRWARSDGHYRSYYGLLMISFPKDYNSLEQRYEDQINGDVKKKLDAAISAMSRF